MRKISFRNIFSSLAWTDVFSKDEPGIARKNMILSGVMATLANSLAGGTFYTGFLLAMGIDIVNINVIGLITLVTGFFNMFSPMLLNRFRHRKKLLIGLRLAVLVFNNLAITVLPFIPLSVGSKIVLLCCFVFITGSINTIVAPGFSAWHMEYMGDNDTRTKYITLQIIINAAVSSVTMLVSGQLANFITSLGDEMEITFIVILRLISVLLVLSDIYFQTRPKEPVYHNTGTGTSLIAIFREPFRYKMFMMTVSIAFIWNFSFYLTVSAFSAYVLDTLQLSYGMVTSVGSLNIICLLLLAPLWRRFIARYSMFGTLIVTMLAQGCTYLMVLFFTPENVAILYPIMCITQYIIGGGLNVAFSNLQWIHLPVKDRTTCLAFYTFASNIFALLGQLFSTAVLAWGEGKTFSLLFIHMDSMQLLMLIEACTVFAVVFYIMLLRKKLEAPDEATEE